MAPTTQLKCWQFILKYKCAKAFMLSEQNIRYLVVPFVGKVCWCTRNYAAGTFKRNNSARLTAWLSWVKEETRETLIFLIIKSQGCLLTSEKSSAEKKLHSNEPRAPKMLLKKKNKLPVKTLSATQLYFEIFLRADGQHNFRKRPKSSSETLVCKFPQRPLFLCRAELPTLIQMHKNIAPWLCVLSDDKTAVNSHQADHTRATH